MRDKWLGFVLLLLLALVLFSIIAPPTNTGRITEYKEREILLKNQIQRQGVQIKTLKSRDSVMSVAYMILQDSAKVIRDTVQVIKIVYKKAVEATDLRPDSTNLLNEVFLSRKLITSQEAHINALLTLNSEADKLLAFKNEIIAAQELQMVDWEARFNNIITVKNAEIKQEKKRGNKKFIKGAIIGAIIALLIG